MMLFFHVDHLLPLRSLYNTIPIQCLLTVIPNEASYPFMWMFWNVLFLFVCFYLVGFMLFVVVLQCWQWNPRLCPCWVSIIPLTYAPSLPGVFQMCSKYTPPHVSSPPKESSIYPAWTLCLLESLTKPLSAEYECL